MQPDLYWQTNEIEFSHTADDSYHILICVYQTYVLRNENVW